MATCTFSVQQGRFVGRVGEHAWRNSDANGFVSTAVMCLSVRNKPIARSSAAAGIWLAGGHYDRLVTGHGRPSGVSRPLLFPKTRATLEHS